MKGSRTVRTHPKEEEDPVLTDVISQAGTELPTWYQEAEAIYETRKESDRVEKYLRARRLAETINTRLNSLGITPLQPADVTPALRLQPALLVRADPELELYAVYATWSDTNEQVALAVQDACEPWRDGPKYSRLLNNVGDIVAARHEGPAPQAMRSEPTDLRASALAAGRSLNQDYLSPDGYAIADQLAALKAAVIHLADVVARSLSRP